MSNEDVHEIEEQRGSTGSASERAFELLIEDVQSLDGFTSEAAKGLRELFDEEREISGDEVLNVVFPEEEEDEGQADAADKED